MKAVKAKSKFIGILFFLLIFLNELAYSALSGAYYIDATNGNDLYTGKTEATAWKTFNNINATTLSAGTKILLKRGEMWSQRLEIRGSGTVDNWITVSSYGTNSTKPKISLTNNKDDIAILLCDLDKTSGTAKTIKISYIQISDLEIANTRLGIYYRCITGTQNTGFRVKNITFNNINCDEVMAACNAGTDKNLKHAEISRQVAAVKGNLQTSTSNTGGGSNEYIFPAGIFVGGKIATNQRVSGSHITVLTEFEVSDCVFNEAIAGVMSVFYWPFTSGMGADAWRQIINKVKLKNCTGTGVVNGMIAFDGVNGGAVPDANGEMQSDANGWGLVENVSVKMGSAVPGRSWPDGTTGVIFSNTQNFLLDKCEFSDVINQGNPDGCGFDFETNCNQVTIQNTKFFNNDGHALLMMNGGSFGGSTHIKIQKNFFAKNIKSSPSLYELELSDPIDGHSDIIVRNNMSFLRKTNKDNNTINFYNTNRTYVKASDNDVYYLDDVAQAITVSFLGQQYSFYATVSAVQLPVVSSLTTNEGVFFSEKTDVTIIPTVTKSYAAYYKVSENYDLAGADWMLFQDSIPFTLSPTASYKTVYLKVKNVVGESAVAKMNIMLKTPPDKLDASTRSHVNIAPNPVSDMAKIIVLKVTDNVNQPIVTDEDVSQISLMTVDGNILQKYQMKGMEFDLDMSHFGKGTFIVRLVVNKNVFTKTIIKN